MTTRRLLAPALLLLVAACGSATRERVIQVLFDAPPTAESAPTPVAPLKPPPVSVEPDTLTFLHAPFARGTCDACHSLTTTKSFRRGASTTADEPLQWAPSRLVDSSNRICYGCHVEMTAQTLRESFGKVHGAVAEGSCLVCHEPHESARKHLLRRLSISELCLQCHTSECIGEIPGHEVPAERTCTNCHNPHACVGAHLLKEPEPRGEAVSGEARDEG